MNKKPPYNAVHTSCGFTFVELPSVGSAQFASSELAGNGSNGGYKSGQELQHAAYTFRLVASKRIYRHYKNESIKHEKETNNNVILPFILWICEFSGYG
jgi:hypothetical protein